MHWRKLLTCSALLTLCSVPATAGSGITSPENLVEFGAYGSFWDTDEADQSFGAGIKMGFWLGSYVMLEFHATHFPDLEARALSSPIDIEADPVDMGLRYNIIPEGRINPYVGGGVTYFFLDSDAGDVEGETGWYGEAGLDTGNEHFRFFAEVMWRQPKGTIVFEGSDTDANFDGAVLSIGGLVRWGN